MLHIAIIAVVAVFEPVMLLSATWSKVTQYITVCAKCYVSLRTLTVLRLSRVAVSSTDEDGCRKRPDLQWAKGEELITYRIETSVRDFVEDAVLCSNPWNYLNRGFVAITWS